MMGDDDDYEEVDDNVDEDSADLEDDDDQNMANELDKDFAEGEDEFTVDDEVTVEKESDDS